MTDSVRPALGDRNLPIFSISGGCHKSHPERRVRLPTGTRRGVLRYLGCGRPSRQPAGELLFVAEPQQHEKHSRVDGRRSSAHRLCGKSCIRDDETRAESGEAPRPLRGGWERP